MVKEKMIVNLPAVISANDYHEFDQAEYFFRQIGLKVKVEEIGLGNGGEYNAIVYKRKDAAYKKLKKLLEEEHDSWMNNN